MFYFTCNESKIYESFTFWNKLQNKNDLFYDIHFFLDAPVKIVSKQLHNIKIGKYCVNNVKGQD